MSPRQEPDAQRLMREITVFPALAQAYTKNHQRPNADASVRRVCGICDMLKQQGVDIIKVANDIIAFAKRNTASVGKQCKPILIGQNIQFDIGFLQQMMNYTGLMEEFEKTFAGTKDYYGHFQPHYIDTILIGRLAFAADKEVTSYKLEIVASQLGVDLDDAHDAAADVTATLDVLGVYTSRLRNNEGTTMSTQQRDKTRKHFKI